MGVVEAAAPPPGTDVPRSPKATAVAATREGVLRLSVNRPETGFFAERRVSLAAMLDGLKLDSRSFARVSRLLAAFAFSLCGLPQVAAAAQGGVPGRSGAEVSPASHHDRSKPLRDIPPARPREERESEKRVKELPLFMGNPFDPVVQASKGPAQAPALGAGFEGVGQGFSGPNGTFSVNSAPPDTNGAVGPNHFVQVVNQSFAVFNKSGAAVYGPVPSNTIWSGFGGACQAHDDGDAPVEYDRLANRWIISQFSVSSTPYLQCVAVSTSSDATGSYNRYSFQYSNFPDYPKLGVWPDAYYTSFNMF